MFDVNGFLRFCMLFFVVVTWSIHLSIIYRL